MVDWGLVQSLAPPSRYYWEPVGGHMSERVLLFSATSWQTVQAFLQDQLLELPSDWAVHIVCSQVPQERTTLRANVHFHEIPMRRDVAITRDLISLVKWLRIVRRISPELLVASTPKASLLSLLACALIGVRRRIYWMHGVRYQSESGFPRKALKFFEGLAILLATEIIPVSRTLIDFVRSEFPSILGSKIVHLPSHASGIDIQKFKPPTSEDRSRARRIFNLPEDALVVGFLGRYTPDKGILDLVAAMTSVVKCFPRALAVFGGFPDDVLPIHLSGIPEFKTEFFRDLGPQETPEIFYHSLDIFCLPSVREGLSTVNLEAAACGLAVVTTDATGCADSIDPGRSGLLVPVAEPSHLANAIGWLLGNSRVRLKMGSFGRDWVVQNFSQKMIWDRNKAIFTGPAESFAGER